MLRGKVVRFDEVRGYGFIAPDDGGDDVFVHANTVDGDKWTMVPGVPVEYEAVDSDRGPKALTVRVTGGAPERSTTAGAGRAREVAAGTEDEEGLCDVLSERTFFAETTEALLTAVPDLTGAQIVAVRARMLALARRHGWVEG
ncbi:cold shock domain-containing protein [Micromonospora sp. NBC_01655]|uniref:cold-shock protein n=1 Tax=Micromonospora sp. NBC_01655 TaxID=2975983 RepID=UPI002254AF12|nr:cold shock domain-containing protein [Micromonospora sp. NBC_01655]MCX4473472.1 cold shock domain-containing protein [Micromonospora sp. NBC_01655]